MAKVNFSEKQWFVAIVAICLMLSPVAYAQSFFQHDRSSARETAARGSKVKLAIIINDLQRQYGGYHSKAELFSKPEGGLEYSIDWITDDGRVLFITVNAETGEVESVVGDT